jgi:hypothetical protein
MRAAPGHDPFVFRASVIVLIAVTAAGLAGCGSPPKPAAAPPTLASPGELSVPLAPRAGLFYVRAAVNGVDAGYFLVDSGSSLTVLDRQLADQLALPKQGQRTVQGIGGSPTVPIVAIDQFSIGGVALGPQTASSIDLSALAKGARLKVGGILGYNTLRQRPFTIDYVAQTLRFHDPATFTPPGNVPGFELHAWQGLPTVRAEVEGRPCWLMLDTGADRSIMLPSAVADVWPEFLPGKRNIATNSHGVGGRIVNIRSTVRSLRVFGLDLREVPVEVEWTSRQSTFNGEVLGRLGTALLSQFRLTFDPQRNKLYAQWRHSPPSAAPNTRPR